MHYAKPPSGKAGFSGSDQLREPPALVFPVRTPAVRLPPISGCQTQSSRGSTAVSQKTNTWRDGGWQGSSLWRYLGTTQTCFSHDHSAATGPNQTGPRPPTSATVQCRVDQRAGQEHSNTACAKNSNSRLHELDTYPSIYRSWRERGKPTVSAARIPPTRRDTPRRTGLAGERPPCPPIQQQTVLVRSAPHSD